MPRLSPAELAARQSGLGATDVVEWLGLAPWEGAGPMRVYVEKTGPAPAYEETPEQAWGHTLEDVIRDWYARERGVSLLPGGPVHHHEHDWLWATLDGVVLGEARNVEIKNVGAQMARDWDPYEDDGIPRYVRAQVMIGMECRGVRECDVVASIGGRPPHVWTVAYDAELAGMLIDGARAAWRCITERVAPPLDATPATKEYLRRKYPSNSDRVIVEADQVLESLGVARMLHARHEAEAKAEKDRIDAEILSRIGKNDGVKGEDWSMTWKLDKNGMRRQRFTDKSAD